MSIDQPLLEDDAVSEWHVDAVEVRASHVKIASRAGLQAMAKGSQLRRHIEQVFSEQLTWNNAWLARVRVDVSCQLSRRWKWFEV